MKKTTKTKFHKVESWLPIVFIFFLLFTINGCRIEDDLIPIVVEPKPEPVVVKGNAYALPESISYAGSTTLYWETNNVASATVNNIAIPINGSKLLEGITSDTTFVFNFTGTNKEVKTDTVKIKVAPPIVVLPTRTDTLCSRYWMLVSSKIFYQNSWLTVNLDEDRLTCKLYFHKNLFFEQFNKDGKLVSNGQWNWIGKDSILIGDQRYKYQLTDTTFVRSERDETDIDIYKGYKITK